VLIIAVSAVYVYYTQLQSTEVRYRDVTVEQAKTLIESMPSLVILDVRTLGEYDEGHIEGAIIIPVQELEERVSELSKEDEILVYCRTGNRSATAVNILNDNGFTKIFHMFNGITAWIQAGYPTVK